MPPLAGKCSAVHAAFEVHQQFSSTWPSGGNQNSRSARSGVRSSKRSQERRFSRDSFTSAIETDAAHKINELFFDALSTSDIQVLFDILDKENQGFIAWQEFALFLMEAIDPPLGKYDVEAIFRLTDQRPDGSVTPAEIQRAFQNPTIKLQLAHLHQKFKVKQEYTASQGITVDVKRDLLVERLDWQVRRDDAIATLPFSFIFLTVFLALVVSHLQIWNRQQVERGLEAWMEGYGKDLPGPYLKQAVAGTSSCWSWLLSSGVSAVFGECHMMAGATPLCRLATRNVLIGDAQLRQARADGSERASWLLNSQTARSHLLSQPGDYLGAATSALQQLRASGWVDEDTDSLQLVFSTYNDNAQMFATTQVTVGFDSYGFVEPVVVASAAIADPYPSVAFFVLDAIYICCILYPMYEELRDLTSWCRMVGCIQGVRGYASFWNGVDWMNIAMGVVQSFTWIQCALAIQADSIQELIHGDELHLIPHVMGLGPDALEAFRSDLAIVIRRFFWLHIIMAANVFVIMLKFFKAFQANPKLQLVTNTLRNAASDLFHFCLVSGAVFTGYGVIGHIMFGGDLVTFNTLSRSLNTGFAVLMGDFGWFVEASESDVRLGSGVPWFLVVIWFWSFMVFNFLILVNMLMAIILEHYADCFSQVKSDPDACALWVQFFRYVKQLRKTQGFLPLSKILCQLADTTQNAHPDQKVTHTSLVQAFQMTPEQASFLMATLRKEARKRKADDTGGQGNRQLARLLQVEGFLEGMSEILRIISLNVSQCSKSVEDAQMNGLAGADQDQGQTQPASDAGGLAEELVRQLQAQGTTMEDLQQVASVLREAVTHLRGNDQSSKPLALVDSSGATSPTSAPDLSATPTGLSRPVASCCNVQKAAKRYQAPLMAY